MHVGLLACDEVADRFRAIGGDYQQMFDRLLSPHIPGLRFTRFDLQSIYLAEIPELLAEVLFGLIGTEADAIRTAGAAVKPVPADDLDMWEVKIERHIEEDATITETDRVALVRARRGQGLFRDRVARICVRGLG